MERVPLLMLANNDHELCTHIAASRGDVDVLQAVLHALSSDQIYAVLMARDQHGDTCLSSAAKYGRIELMITILSSLPVQRRKVFASVRNFLGRTAFHYLADLGNESAINQCLITVSKNEQSALLDIKDNAGNTALAIIQGKQSKPSPTLKKKLPVSERGHDKPGMLIQKIFFVVPYKRKRVHITIKPLFSV